MFREMRRKKQQMPQEAAVEILEKSTSGVLAVTGDEGYPYTVPLSHVYVDGKLYFHSAVSGHKIDAIKSNDKATFCVIDKDKIVPEEYTTYFRSVVAFGRVRLLEEEAEVREAARKLAMKYSADYEAGIDKEIDDSIKHMAVIEFDIEHLTAKEAIELVKARK